MPSDQTGAASGMSVNMRTISGAIGAAVMSTIVTSRVDPNGLPLEAGYTSGSVVLAAFAIVAALASILVPSARRARAVVEPVAEVRAPAEVG